MSFLRATHFNRRQLLMSLDERPTSNKGVELKLRASAWPAGESGPGGIPPVLGIFAGFRSGRRSACHQSYM